MNKKYHKIIITYILISIFFIYAAKLTAQTYGLKFQGQDVTLDKRTELNLTPDSYLKFKDEFEISFDYKLDLNDLDLLYGYVVRIINEDNFNVDLISTPDPEQPLNLVIGKNNRILTVIPSRNIINQWINLRIKFNLSEDRLIFYKPDTFFVQNDIGFKKQDAFKIIFGANDFKQFKTTDVASMNIRNIKLEENGNLKYYWPLDVKEGNVAIDRIKKTPALVKNPVWLIKNHESWQKNYETEVKGLLKIASDEENGKIFMVGSNELFIYTANDNNISKITYQNKINFLVNNCHVFFNSRDNKIYCYSIEESPIYSLNIETGEWDETGKLSDTETKYRHHNRYYNPTDSSLYIFGGYGFHQYNNEIFKVDLKNDTWSLLKSNDSIFRPRYLAGLGALNDTLYILGGYGSESGNQMINPQSYYDLIGYSIETGTSFKKFEIPRIIDDMVVANSMWVNGKTRNYYALIFEKTKFDGYLQLIKGNLDSPEIEMLGDKIPYRFHDIKSLAGLMFMPKQEKLFAFTVYSPDSATTQTEIYSISYPPNQFVSESNLSTTSNLTYWIIGVILLLIFVLVLKSNRKKKNKRNLQDIEIQDSENIEQVDYNPSITEAEEIKYQLIFFGGFQVFNKDLVDITNKFSPLLKELFLLIMLNTFKNNKGIASEKISEILWYDKSEKSARNNKAVNIAKLRNILSEIGGCELTKKTGYWKIVPDFNKNKSDYLDFLSITSSKRNLTKQKIIQLIKITEKGSFLHNVQYDWLDEFKAAVSEKIIDALIEYAGTRDIKNDADFIIHLADCVFNFDLINEDAMILKCKAEYFMGKHTLAKSTYERFFKEYQAMYNQEYEKSFLDILEINE